MAKRCIRCFRPEKTCYCKYIEEVNTGVKFVILMHPREAYRQKTGTGRLAHLSLTDSEILIGVDFTRNRRVNELIGNTNNFCITLYPDKDSIPANVFHKVKDIGQKQLVIFLIDATWLLAKKMLKESPNIMMLPKVSFSRNYKSEFTFKKQPQENFLSTIESIYYLIREFQEGGVIKSSCNPIHLIEVFKTMVNFQITCEKEVKDEL